MTHNHLARAGGDEATYSPRVPTENQPEGWAHRPGDRLDHATIRHSAILSGHDPVAKTRHGQENDFRAGQEEAGAQSRRSSR